MNRPRIQIQKTKTDRITEVLSLLFVLTSVLLILFYQSELPDKIQIPFNWPSKNEEGMVGKHVIWMSPLICGVIITILLLLTRIPHFFNYPIKVTEENAHTHYIKSPFNYYVLFLLQ